MLINLLPTNEKEFLRLEKIYRSIIFFSRILFAILLILIVLLLAILFFLKIQLAGIEKARSIESQSASAIAIKALKSEISFINQKLMDINRLQTEQKFSPAILEDLAQLAPPGVQLSSFFFDAKTQKAVLDGRASTRDSFIYFKTALENSPKFYNIDSPLSNLTKSAENNFRISFQIK
ncbi:MAG: hypothetical protein UT31_C0002G0011 [Parcubacteria group bacterium GW2011_GWF2_39_13b]|nr:MAG: hypothetical protein UT31_C0002G0011 [Parcubacteria group bacterium GW2011_GWF2_39_13b]